MKETGRDFKVGLFVLGGLALFLAFVLNTDVLKLNRGFEVKAMFNYTYGLYVGAPVQLAGVPVGSVEAIKIHRDDAGKMRVEVLSRIDAGIRVDKGSTARINLQGLLGQKYLEIVPPTIPADALEMGGLILGEDPVAIENIASSGGDIIRKLETSIDYINTVMGDEEFRMKIKQNVTGFSDLIKSLNEVSRSLNLILDRLEKGEGTVGKFLTEEEIYNDVRDLVKDLKANPWKILKKDKKDKKGFWPF